MTKEELNKLSISEIEDIIDVAIQDAHLQFLAQLSDGSSKENVEELIPC